MVERRVVAREGRGVWDEDFGTWVGIVLEIGRALFFRYSEQ